MAVPSNTLVRDLKAPEPPLIEGQRPRKAPFLRVDRWRAGVPEKAWQTIEIRDAEKGPLVVQVAWTLVQARTEGKASKFMETLVVFREKQSDGTVRWAWLSEWR